MATEPCVEVYVTSVASVARARAGSISSCGSGSGSGSGKSFGCDPVGDSPRAIDCCGTSCGLADSVSDVTVPILSTESGNVATEPGDLPGDSIAGDLV